MYTLKYVHFINFNFTLICFPAHINLTISFKATLLKT